MTNAARRPLALLAALLLAPLACATEAEKEDRALIRGRQDPGLETLGRVAGPGVPSGRSAPGEAVKGRWVGEGVTVAQVTQGAAGEAGGSNPTPDAPRRPGPPTGQPASPAAAPQDARRLQASPGNPASVALVVSVRGQTVYLDLGRQAGASVGQRLRVLRSGAPLVHPVTGETLGTMDDEVAVVEITSVAEKFSTARVVSVAEGQAIQPKDRVVPAEATAAAQPGGTGKAPEDARRLAAAPDDAASLAAGHLTSATPSQELAYAVRDLAAGDLDGDGRPELVAIEESRFLVYRWTGRRLELLFEEESSNRREYVYADAADLDGDGRAEVVVNDAADQSVQAAVLVQDGRRLVRHALPRGHYFRIVGAEIGQPTLVGQRRGDGGEPFVGDVHRYEWARGKARRKEAVWLPLRTAIFDFQLYRTPEGSVEVATLAFQGRLRLYKGQEEVWSSQQQFDGTKLRVVEKNPSPPQSTAGQDKIETPIPGRIVVLPGLQGRDGAPVPAFALRRNEQPTVLAPRFVFSRGQVVAIAVDGPVTRELWSSEKLEGYVAAFRLVDLGPTASGVGGHALVTAIDLQRGIFKAARSAVMVQGLR